MTKIAITNRDNGDIGKYFSNTIAAWERSIYTVTFGSIEYEVTSKIRIYGIIQTPKSELFKITGKSTIFFSMKKKYYNNITVSSSVLTAIS